MAEEEGWCAVSFDDYTADEAMREKYQSAYFQWREETAKLQEELKATHRELEYAVACIRQRDEENARLKQNAIAAQEQKEEALRSLESSQCARESIATALKEAQEERDNYCRWLREGSQNDLRRIQQILELEWELNYAVHCVTENEELWKELGGVKKQAAVGSHELYQHRVSAEQYAKEFAAMGAEIAALRRDRERLDWLDRSAGAVEYHDPDECAPYFEVSRYSGSNVGRGRILRDAIDAAIGGGANG